MIVSWKFVFWREAECCEIDSPNMLWEGNDAGSPNCQTNGQGCICEAGSVQS